MPVAFRTVMVAAIVILAALHVRDCDHATQPADEVKP